jgi:hypothetical protein
MPITNANDFKSIPPVLPEIPTDGSVHVIPLNRGLYAVIDIADKPLIDGWNFSASITNSDPVRWQISAWRGSRKDGTRKNSSLHRILTGHAITDHRDGCVFDNRRFNLREASDSDNQCNRALQQNNTSGFKGVSWNKQNAKWKAEIEINGKSKYLGYFTDKLDAALAFDVAPREFHGQFATLNFPLIGERSAITGEIRPFDPVEYPELVRHAAT